MYNRLGKASVKFALRYARRRYRRQARVALGVAAVGLGIAAYLVTREVPEG